MKKIAIIPARGGSKGLPGKNIRMLGDKPLITHTILAACEASSIKNVYVTTDCPEIARISEESGASVPWLRPAELATDQALARDAYIHFIDQLEMSGLHNPIESFVVLQPTSPLRSAWQIDEACQLFDSKAAKAVVSVKKSNISPHWFKKLDDLGALKDYFTQESPLQNRQSYTQAYLPNGAIYVFERNFFFNTKNYYDAITFPYVMDEQSSVDIDSLYDFQFAEYLMQISDFKR